MMIGSSGTFHSAFRSVAVGSSLAVRAFSSLSKLCHRQSLASRSGISQNQTLGIVSLSATETSPNPEFGDMIPDNSVLR